MFHTTACPPVGLFRAFAAARIRRHHEAVPCGPPTDAWETRHPRRRKKTVSPAGCASAKSASRRPPGPQSPGATRSGRPMECPTRGREARRAPRSGALRIRPGVRLTPWPRWDSPSGLSLRLQAAAALARPAGGRGEEERDSEWRSSPPPNSRPPPPLPSSHPRPAPHHAWTEISPCRRRAWTSRRALRCTSEVQSPGWVDSAPRAAGEAWIPDGAVGRGLARQRETAARAAAGIPLRARARDRALTAVLAAPPAAAAHSALDPFALGLYLLGGREPKRLRPAVLPVLPCSTQPRRLTQGTYEYTQGLQWTPGFWPSEVSCGRQLPPLPNIGLGIPN